MNEAKILKEAFGFSPKEAKIFSTLARFGEMNVTTLAKRTNIKRTTVYNILPALISNGFIDRARSGGRTVYFVDDVRNLSQVLEERQINLQELVKSITTTSRPFDTKPKIRVYEGCGGMRRFYQDIITSSAIGSEILTFFGAGDLDAFLGHEIVAEYVQKRIEKGIKNRIIINEGVVAERWKDTAKKELREIKIVHFLLNDTSTDFKIYGNKISFLCYHDNFFAVTIENKELSNLQRNMFEMLWSRIW